MPFSRRTPVRASQGSTLLWTEHYDVTHPSGAREWARDAALSLALFALAGGPALFVVLQGPFL